MTQFLHARDPTSLLPGSLCTCSYLYCTTHRQPVHESTTWKERQDEQQWEKQGHNLNSSLCSSKGKDCAWDDVKIPAAFCTVDLFLTSTKSTTVQPEYQDLHSFHKSSPALPTHHQVRTESFPNPVHLALASSYAAPMWLLSKTSHPSHQLSIGPFATWQQAGTLLAKAATYRVLVLPEESALPCHGTTVRKCPKWSTGMMWGKSAKTLPETLTHLEVWFF